MYKPTLKEYMLFGVFSFIENKKVRNVLSGVAYGLLTVYYARKIKELV